MLTEQQKGEFVKNHPWIDPHSSTERNFILREGVENVKNKTHVLVKLAACHKMIPCMEPIHSKDIQHVDGYDWELFSVAYKGTVDGKEYYWGMFVEGLGLFSVMVLLENTRELLPEEQEIWSKKVLGVYGSHSDKLSYTMPSGV